MKTLSQVDKAVDDWVERAEGAERTGRVLIRMIYVVPFIFILCPAYLIASILIAALAPLYRWLFR